MKKLLSVLLSIILVFGVSASITVYGAYYDSETGFHYDETAKEIVITDDKANNQNRIYEPDEIETDEIIYGEALIGLNINDGVTEIGEDIMAGCDKLTYVKIPKSVKKIKKGAFSDCDNLKTIYFAGTKSQWEKIRIEEVGNEDLLDADVEYGEKDVVNNIPLYIILGVVVIASLGLTLASTRKARKK